MRRLINRPGDRTNPLVWFAAIVLAILAIAVIIAGIVVFAIYMIYRPRIPYIEVVYAHLDKLDYDQSGLLNSEMTLTMVAENDNAKADASLSDMSFSLLFQDIEIAELRADPFDIPRNHSLPLTYDIPSSPIPLDEGGMEAMDAALKQDRIKFHLEGQARARWRVGVFLSVKFWTHLSCDLNFFPSNKSSDNLDCSSKSH